ncbi:Guanosine polyphosphate pyrophosphohydrolases/synthetases homolog [Rickettsia felis URRWXCal2]|uniref:Guanosine polyphosphate pyrophosphohydrolases/synthetases homolog n=1 Tax=Rickettsia felis (strain ATCC VR-1525 / URRWXCal2) TaxID=315456 RepID=Q4UJL3_RICFE|nr:HD domain-containing protein [Rickettsia felis]AAY61289.1 Guanosine polyphosphate pyrophosphohydrolases/synthetases homolog [Rickettsia felis URRWXCal2]KHO02807.1 guanosine polyphosphate pyrophosphohydrolase [Rickettsia felis str. LSU]KHO03747.1 guanosine polyphosphate pyrophosphohydrolase [Rickettsia felis]
MKDLSSWKEKFEVCVYAKKLLDKLEYLNTKVKNPVDIEEVKKGIYYARKYHGSQMRQSGDPYYSHPIEVAYMFVQFVAEEAPKLYNAIMLQAALLHDTIEDTELTEEVITTIFGLEVAKHVEGLTRVKPYGKITAKESLNLLIKQKRYNIALIKLFDRIHNVQTLGAKSLEKAQKIIEETITDFLVVAARLEIHSIEEKLFNICNEFIKGNKTKTIIKFDAHCSFLNSQSDAARNNSLLLPVS